MKLQVLCITNDHLVIRRTLTTWKNQATRIVVLANGVNKHLIKEELQDFCSVIIGEFNGFSETRNKLIDLAQCDKYDYNIMIDDSFELHGDIITELKKQTLNHGLIKVKPSNSNEIQNRKLIFKRGKYNGHIHETLVPDGPTFQIENVFILDVVYKHQVIRSFERMDYDLLMLSKEPKNRRTDYYTATILMKKSFFKESLVIFNELILIKDRYGELSERSISLINHFQKSNCLSKLKVHL